jgi:hypothetical protein
MNAQITSFDDLKRFSNGIVVTLPGFVDGEPFVVRVRKASLMALMAKGKIPNALKTKANELFTGGVSLLTDEDNENMLNDLYDIMSIFAEASLIEPSMEQIREAGLELTDDQLMALFTYSQKGVKGLESFRQEQGDTQPNNDGEAVQ